MELEFGQHQYSFLGTYSELIKTVQNAIIFVIKDFSIVEGVRFVGSNSLQRPIVECCIIDLDVHVLLKSNQYSDYLLVLECLEKSLKISLPKIGINLASINAIHGLYKPAPLEKGIRLLIHALIADIKRYLEIDPSLRYSWKKYKSSIGSFDYVDAFSHKPTIRDVLYGKEGVMFYMSCIRSGRAKLGIIHKGQDNEVEEVIMESTEQSILHELYTSSVIYNYRNLCRAFGVLDEKLGNLELFKFIKESWEDSHHILTPFEAKALAICVNSKDRLRNGSIEELSPSMIEMLRQTSLAFFESIIERFKD